VSDDNVIPFKEKIKSISFGMQKRRKQKVTTDVHDTHTVDTVEHWSERVDVTVKPPTVAMTLTNKESQQ
jgi:hypothetical protein